MKESPMELQKNKEEQGEEVNIFTPNLLKKWMRANATYPQTGILIWSAVLDSIIEEFKPSNIDELIDIIQQTPDTLPDDIAQLALERMHRAHVATGVAMTYKGKEQEMVKRLNISESNIRIGDTSDIRLAFDNFLDEKNILILKNQDFTLEEIKTLSIALQNICYQDPEIKKVLFDYREMHRGIHSDPDTLEGVKLQIREERNRINAMITKKILEDNTISISKEKVLVFLDATD